MSLSVDSVGSNNFDSLQGLGAGITQAIQELAKIEQIIQELIKSLQASSNTGSDSPSTGGGGAGGGGMPSYSSGAGAPQSLAATPSAGVATGAPAASASPAATGDGSGSGTPAGATDAATTGTSATSATSATAQPDASTAVQSTASAGGDMTPQQVASQYKSQIESASQATGVPPGIIAGQIWQESKGVADTPGGGLMQLGTNEFQQYGGGDISNPADNINAGAAYMKDLSSQFGGNMQAALRAYNSGPNGVDLANLNSTPAGTGDPTYVQKVMQAAQESGLATA